MQDHALTSRRTSGRRDPPSQGHTWLPDRGDSPSGYLDIRSLPPAVACPPLPAARQRGFPAPNHFHGGGEAWRQETPFPPSSTLSRSVPHVCPPCPSRGHRRVGPVCPCGTEFIVWGGSHDPAEQSLPSVRAWPRERGVVSGGLSLGRGRGLGEGMALGRVSPPPRNPCTPGPPQPGKGFYRLHGWYHWAWVFPGSFPCGWTQDGGGGGVP